LQYLVRLTRVGDTPRPCPSNRGTTQAVAHPDCGTGFQPVKAQVFVACGTGFQPVQAKTRCLARVTGLTSYQDPQHAPRLGAPIRNKHIASPSIRAPSAGERVIHGTARSTQDPALALGARISPADCVMDPTSEPREYSTRKRQYPYIPTAK